VDFGDNVEDRLGHVRFLAFYLACGLAAALTQIYIHPTSKIPMVGAVGLWRGIGSIFDSFPVCACAGIDPHSLLFQIVELPASLFLVLVSNAISQRRDRHYWLPLLDWRGGVVGAYRRVCLRSGFGVPVPKA
jgi:membrane associated rhomboid family serine protease